MAGILDKIATDLFAGFKGKLHKGTLKRVASDPAAGLNEFGDPQDRVTTTWGCEGFVDNSSRGFKGVDQVPEHAVTVCIFGRSLVNGSVRPELDDMVQFPKGTGPWYQIKAPARTDPANALWECGAIEVQDATAADCRARGM